MIPTTDVPAPVLRLDVPNDRYTADAKRRTLKTKLTRYLTEGAADALLAGRPVNVEVAPEHEAAVMALMSEVARFVRGL